jgi:hypothetical protein
MTYHNSSVSCNPICTQHDWSHSGGNRFRLTVTVTKTVGLPQSPVTDNSTMTDQYSTVTDSNHVYAVPVHRREQRQYLTVGTVVATVTVNSYSYSYQYDPEGSSAVVIPKDPVTVMTPKGPVMHAPYSGPPALHTPKAHRNSPWLVEMDIWALGLSLPVHTTSARHPRPPRLVVTEPRFPEAAVQC